MTTQSQSPRGGAYRRVVDIAIEPLRARVAMEDDIHHFRVALDHDGAGITAVTVDSPRTPWTTCGGAAAALERLVGQPLAGRVPFADAAAKASHCTHLLDLANIALGRLGEPGFARRYEIAVEYRPDREIHAAMTWTGSDSGGGTDNGSGSETWEIGQGTIRTGAWQGTALAALPAAIAAWPFAAQEPVLVLRRAVGIAGGRFFDLDRFATAADLRVEASCFTLLPEVRDRALRNKGSAIDFWGEGRWPLAHGAAAPASMEGQA